MTTKKNFSVNPNGISDSTYYKWNKDFIEADKACSPENKIYSSSLYRNNFCAYYLLLPAF